MPLNENGVEETPGVDTSAPPAKNLPGGTTVLSTDGTDRSKLRQGMFAWALVFFVGGYVVGRSGKNAAAAVLPP